MLNKIFRPSESIVARSIGDEVILVPIRGEVADLENIYTLNETAAVIWRLLDGGNPPAAIVERLVREYGVREPEAAGDVIDCLLELLSIGALRECVRI